MMTRMFAAGCLVLMGATPAGAASITSSAFVAAVAPTVAFLAGSSRLAADGAGRPRVRAFARAEIAGQVSTGDALERWRDDEARRRVRDAAAPTLDGLGPVAGAITLPFDTLAAATEGAAPPLTPLPSAESLRAAAEADLGALSTLRGSGFDALYLARQTDALTRLVAAYKDFILNGDDPDLRALAVHKLPRAETLLAAVRRLAA